MCVNEIFILFIQHDSPSMIYKTFSSYLYTKHDYSLDYSLSLVKCSSSILLHWLNNNTPQH